MRVSMTVNDSTRDHDVEPRLLLVQYLRDVCGLTGTKVGCDTSSCGACTVLARRRVGEVVHDVRGPGRGARSRRSRACTRPAQLHPMQQAFHEHHALQCGFCTAGMVMAAVSLLDEIPGRNRARRAARARGQPLPLHRLSEHRQGRARGRRAGDERRRELAAPAAARTRCCSPARRGSSTTFPSPARCTSRSCAARSRTRASARSTPTRPRAMPGVVAVLTGADLRDDWQTPLPCAWPVTDDMKNPAALAAAGRRGVLRRRRRCGRRRRERDRGRSDAMEAVVVDYEELPAVLDLEDAVARPGARPSRARRPTRATTGSSSPTPTPSTRAFADAVHTVERTVRAAAADPDGDGATRRVRRPRAVRRRRHRLLVDADPAHPQDPARDRPGDRRAPAPRGRPAVGGGFGSKLNVYAEEALCARGRAAAAAARAMDRGTHARRRSRPSTAAGMIQDDRARRRRRRADHRRPRPTSSPTWARTSSS